MTSMYPPGISPDMIPSMAPPPGIEPNFLNSVTQATSIVAVSATTSALAFVLLSLRLYSTLGITRSASYDDGASAIAFIFSLSYAGLVIATRDDARHGWDLPISAYTAGYFKIILCETIIAAIGFLFSKLSILLLLFRLFSPTRKFTYFAYIGIAWATIISLTSIVVAGALCAPRDGESFSSMAVAERCTHEEIWAVVQGALNMALDFYILCLPIPMVLSLQMGRKRKIGVMAIFMTGLIACAASTANLGYKVKLLDSSDTVWNSYIVDILNIIELNIAIMVACMPACASISRYCFHKLDIVSSIKSRLTGNSKQKIYDSDSNTATPPESHPEASGHGSKYWKIRNPFSSGSGGGSAPPQITMNQKHSRVMQTGDFDVFEKTMDRPALANTRTRRASFELQKASLDEEKKAPHDMV